MNDEIQILEEFEISELEERVEFSICSGSCSDEGVEEHECKVF